MDPIERLQYALPEEELLREIQKLRSRQADDYRNLEEEFRQRNQKLREDHEQEIQNCIRQYFAKNNQDQPEDLSLHRQHAAEYSGSSSGANSFSSQANLSQSGFALQMAAAQASVSGQAAGPPLVTLASSNFLMPPPPNQSQSSHSSTEDCSGCSNEVRHKLHEHLMQKHRRECPTCSSVPSGNLSDCNCDISASIAAGALTIGGAASKIRPVIRTYSAPLPLTNPAFFQPQASGLPSMPTDPYPIPPTDQEMYNIKQHIRNNVLQKSKFKRKSSAQK